MSRNFFNEEFLLVSLFVLGWLIVWPFGEFPINDDFAYTGDVKRLVEQGVFSVHTWSAAIFITQLLYGAFFAKLFGFSFIVLRLSVALLSIISLLSLFRFLKKYISTPIALFISLALLVNPMWMYYSVTFMTEVPFTLCLLIGTFYYIKFLETDKAQNLVIATVISIIAVLLRQFAILLPLAFSSAYFVKAIVCRGDLRRSFLLLITPFVLTAVAMILASNWLTESRQQIGEVTAKFDNINNTFSKGFLYIIQRVIFCTYAYLGYAFAPFFPLVFILIIKSIRVNKLLPISLVLMSVILTFLFFKKFGFIFPFLDNTISTNWLGPILIDGRGDQLSNTTIWIVVTFLVIITTNYILFVFVSTLFREGVRKYLKNYTFLFLILFLVAYLLSTTIVFPFDRYVVPIMPILLILLSSQLDIEFISRSIKDINTRIVIWGGYILFFLIVSVALRDSFTMQRARWELANSLISKQVSPSSIDGGFEFNGWYTYKRGSILVEANKNWWWVDDNKYIISFDNNKKGYKVIDRRVVNRLIPYLKQDIFLFERE